ncbi:RNA-binding S4 domain-containing protein [Paracoccus zhejiangensis]|uniref:RNA-binding protein n=1 Tax=Paracoccus zhejiangensis TaxID=1077935 RepID=A0A2H5EVB5_9RHOB|nr:RNA-binding S4 domain-containing protein [Paracoccus zhejiangensis]AUH63241.1 RNA-binding protein [Paracoccus zhejiangensis]
MSEAPDSIRLDKWLVHVRLFKTRGLAAERIEGGGVRVNGQPSRKPGRSIRPGDEVTVSMQGRVRALRMIAPGVRRGPASEAQTLYEDLTEPGPTDATED